MRGLILGACAMVLLTFQAKADGIVDVDGLNKILQQKHAGWVAKPTHLNSMGLDQLHRMMGVKRTTGHGASFTIHRTRHANLPAVVDWRSNNNGNWVTPILDQGVCGSCVAFASIGTLETQFRISTGFTGFNARLSPQFLMECGGGSCDGWEPGPAADFLRSTGTPAESCMPYTSGETGNDVACTSSCANPSATIVKIASYKTPTQDSFDIDSLKQALQHGPLVTTLDVYADFMVYSSGVYKHVSGDMLGGHAVSIVGYDDTQQALIIRNSWGEDWGESGFAYVAYTDISGVGQDTWSYTMPTYSGGVTVESPLDYSYFTGTAPVKSNSTISGTDSITVTFFDKNNTAAVSTVCQSNSCSQTADVSKLSDGQYSVVATAMDSTGKQLGQSAPQNFYVSNTKPTLSVSFQGTQGSDLTQTLSGDIMIQINLSSSNGVGPSSVVFHYKGSNGVETTSTSNMVADGMLVDWGSDHVPDGQAQLWVDAHLTTNGFDQVVTTAVQTVTVKQSNNDFVKN